MTKEEFVKVRSHLEDSIQDILISHPYLRLGQCTFNTVYQYVPELCDEIRGTNNDPFYRDDNLDKFWNYIENALTNV